MTRVFFMMREVACAAVFLVPIFLILNRSLFRDSQKTALYFLFSCYLSAVYALVGLPNVTYIRLDLNLNWIPFLGMIGDLKNSILNVLLFVPLGFFLPVLWEKYRDGKKAVLFGMGLSLAIELLQIFTLRATDINDLITNTLGTALGFFVGKRVWNDMPAVHSKTEQALFLSLGAATAVMFLAQPVFSNLLWHLFR